MLEPFGARLGLVTGKGGVGKTCVVAALGLAAAAEGRRPILVELGHRASLEALFDRPIGFAPTTVAPGLEACNLEIDATLRDYVARYVRFSRVAEAIVENRALGRLFRAAPAVVEVAALARVAALLDRYDPVLVDLDATGHALMLLELPAVFADLGVGGPVRRLLARAEALFDDAENTRVHVVTLPGELPVQESLELCAALAPRARLGALVVNRVPRHPWPFEEALLARLETAAADRDDADLASDCALVRRATIRHRALCASLTRLDAVAMPRVHLPERGALTGPDDLRALLAEAEVHR